MNMKEANIGNNTKMIGLTWIDILKKFISIEKYGLEDNIVHKTDKVVNIKDLKSEKDNNFVNDAVNKLCMRQGNILVKLITLKIDLLLYTDLSNDSGFKTGKIYQYIIDAIEESIDFTSEHISKQLNIDAKDVQADLAFDAISRDVADFIFECGLLTGST